MKTWEYKVVPFNGIITTRDAADIEHTLNNLGSGGWELVNIIPQIDSSSNSDYQVEDVRVQFNHLVFKRENEY